MNNNTEINKSAALNLTTKFFIGFVGLNTVLGLFFGILPFANFPMVLEFSGIPYSDKLLIFGVVSGTAVLFLTGICILSIIWTRKGKAEGAVIGIAAGIYLFAVGILAWIITGSPDAFFLDSFRGLLTIILGMQVYRNLKG